MIQSDVVAIIHAKGKSERVPKKNLQVVGNKPLVGHAIKKIQKTESIDLIWVDSDDDEILRIAGLYGAGEMKRPPKVNGVESEKMTGDELAYYIAQQFPKIKYIAQVLPTSPFIRPETYDTALDLLQKHPQMDCAVGVREEVFYLWENGKPAYYKNGHLPDSQEIRPLVYETTGFYIFKTEYVLRHKKRINPEKTILIHLTKLESVDINTPEDLEFARLLWKALRKERKSFGFDIDGTITLYDAKGDYDESIPNIQMVNKINKLYNEGHYITITTSRGHSRGTREIMLELAKEQLEEWGVKYHRLIPKTFYDKLVDDATESPEEFLNEN